MNSRLVKLKQTIAWFPFWLFLCLMASMLLWAVKNLSGEPQGWVYLAMLPLLFFANEVGLVTNMLYAINLLCDVWLPRKAKEAKR